MTWQDQQPPWGKPKRPTNPEDLIAVLLKKIKDGFSGGNQGDGSDKSAPPPGLWGGLGKIALIIAALVLFNVVYSSFYTIEPGERGVVLRFGKYSKISTPGLNFKMPLVDTVVKVDIESVRKEEFGFRTKIPGQQTLFEKRGYEAESLMLTGDRNVIDAEWIVQYKIRDPLNFLFKIRNARQAVRDLSEMAIRRIVGNMDFDYVLSNREILAAQTKKEVQAALDKYESGISIVTVQLQDVNPPDAVKPAFNEVNEADQDMKRLVNEAEEAYNRQIPKARGTAKKIIEESHGYAVARVNKAKGDTARFLDVLKEYQKAKEVTRRRMYLETMQDTLPAVTDIYVIDKEARSLLPFLDITGDRQRQKNIQAPSQ